MHRTCPICIYVQKKLPTINIINYTLFKKNVSPAPLNFFYLQYSIFQREAKPFSNFQNYEHKALQVSYFHCNMKFYEIIRAHLRSIHEKIFEYSHIRNFVINNLEYIAFAP
jgi:hypothetical protein